LCISVSRYEAYDEARKLALLGILLEQLQDGDPELTPEVLYLLQNNTRCFCELPPTGRLIYYRKRNSSNPKGASYTQRRGERYILRDSDGRMHLEINGKMIGDRQPWSKQTSVNRQTQKDVDRQAQKDDVAMQTRNVIDRDLSERTGLIAGIEAVMQEAGHRRKTNLATPRTVAMVIREADPGDGDVNTSYEWRHTELCSSCARQCSQSISYSLA